MMNLLVILPPARPEGFYLQTIYQCLPDFSMFLNSRFNVFLHYLIATLDHSIDSSPHHSATYSAIAVVILFKLLMLTHSSKPWMLLLIGP